MKKILLVIISIFIITGCSLNDNVTEDNVVNYLNNKYGDHNFKFAKEGNCNLNELNDCWNYYTSD